MLTFWNNYFSKDHWQAASATYFLYSCKYALTVQVFFLCDKIFLKLEKNKRRASVKFIQLQLKAAEWFKKACCCVFRLNFEQIFF